MVVLTAVYKVKGIKQKTQAKAFKALKVGDVFELKYDGNGHYKGSPHIEVWLNGVKQGTQTALQMKSTFRMFDLEEIDFERDSLINFLIWAVERIEGVDIGYDYYREWTKEAIREEADRMDYLLDK